jgi:DNA-binding NarL/FixJ family response regulator
MADNPPSENSHYGELLTSIVKRFVRLVGASAALSVARKVPLLLVDGEGNVLDFNQADPLSTVTILLDHYRAVFGEVTVTLAHQAATPTAAVAEERNAPETRPPLSPMFPIKILVVDDHILFREGIANMLDPQPDMKVVGQASSAKEAVVMTRNLKPNLVLMDMSLPDGTGLEATQAILAELPQTKIVFLTVHDNDETLFAAIRAGAAGYLYKNVRVTELLRTLRGVARGEAGISRLMALRVLDEFSRLPQITAESSETVTLTMREIEIVRQLADGATNHEIARKFSISESTVKNHVRNVLSKLHLHSRHDVVTYARSRGLLTRVP